MNKNMNIKNWVLAICFVISGVYFTIVGIVGAFLLLIWAECPEDPDYIGALEEYTGGPLFSFAVYLKQYNGDSIMAAFLKFHYVVPAVIIFLCLLVYSFLSSKKGIEEGVLKVN